VTVSGINDLEQSGGAAQLKDPNLQRQAFSPLAAVYAPVRSIDWSIRA
jgi:hypothetical protein